MAKTALNELVGWITNEILLNPYYKDCPQFKLGARTIKVKAEALLKKEKEQILQAYEKGGANVIKYAMLEGYDDNELPINSEKYYNETYE